MNNRVIWIHSLLKKRVDLFFVLTKIMENKSVFYTCKYVLN